jgi:hypothetical protein
MEDFLGVDRQQGDNPRPSAPRTGRGEIAPRMIFCFLDEAEAFEHVVERRALFRRRGAVWAG